MRSFAAEVTIVNPLEPGNLPLCIFDEDHALSHLFTHLFQRGVSLVHRERLTDRIVNHLHLGHIRSSSFGLLRVYAVTRQASSFTRRTTAQRTLLPSSVVTLKFHYLKIPSQEF